MLGGRSVRFSLGRAFLPERPPGPKNRDKVGRANDHMPYYALERSDGGLYAMNMALSEDEARRYGHEGETVRAILVWTRSEFIVMFLQALSAMQHDATSPFRGLIEDMRAGRVDALELSAGHLRDRLRRYGSTGFVAALLRARSKGFKRSRSFWRTFMARRELHDEAIRLRRRAEAGDVELFLAVGLRSRQAPS
jgi:hypothetical protein